MKADIVAAFQTHKLHMLCLSELGELGIGLSSKLPDKSVNAWLKELLSDSAVSPVSVYSDSHYATLVKTGRVLVEEKSDASNISVCTFMEMTHQCQSSTAMRQLR